MAEGPGLEPLGGKVIGLALGDVRFRVPRQQVVRGDHRAQLVQIVAQLIAVFVQHVGRNAVVLSTDDLEAIEEALAILADPAAMREIEQGRAAIASGDVVTKDEIPRSGFAPTSPKSRPAVFEAFDPIASGQQNSPCSYPEVARNIRTMWRKS